MRTSARNAGNSENVLRHIVEWSEPLQRAGLSYVVFFLGAGKIITAVVSEVRLFTHVLRVQSVFQGDKVGYRTPIKSARASAAVGLLLDRHSVS